jgi:hypothetical protein
VPLLLLGSPFFRLFFLGLPGWPASPCIHALILLGVSPPCYYY